MVSAGAPFGPDVVEAIARHMNDDHAEDTARIARAFGADPAVVAARVVDLDGEGLDLVVVGPHGTGSLRVPWRQPIGERAAVRGEVVWLHDEACRRLGIEPPSH